MALLLLSLLLLFSLSFQVGNRPVDDPPAAVMFWNSLPDRLEILSPAALKNSYFLMGCHFINDYSIIIRTLWKVETEEEDSVWTNGMMKLKKKARERSSWDTGRAAVVLKDSRATTRGPTLSHTLPLPLNFELVYWKCSLTPLSLLIILLQIRRIQIKKKKNCWLEILFTFVNF